MFVKNLIIGAGISGLFFAHSAKEDFLILEKEPEVGGYCRTVRKKDYIWDYAGHFYHFKTDYFKNLFRECMPESETVSKTKCTKIFYKHKLIDYPFQTNIHQLEKDEFIDCLYDLFFKTEKEDYASFLDMLYGKFGKAITEKFLRPYNEKLYAVDLTTLDRDAMGRFFPYADLTQIIRNMKTEENSSYNNTFLYPKNGAIAFVEKVYRMLDEKRVLLNTEVTALDREAKTVTTADGTVYEYENLINTMPLNRFFELTGDRALADSLSYNKVLVFNLGFDKKSKAFTEEHWLYFPEKEYNFYRVGFYDNILDADKLSMYIEIGFSKNAQIDIDAELKAALEGLKLAGITDESMTLCEYAPIVMDPAYVHINSETDKAVRAWEASAAADGIYTIGRYGAWTYCSMEDCMIEAKELSESL